ncbi:MAG TPA: phage tail sheath C-terminal domain-containing protein [Burkholderiaceae bacterium]|nr:phage tail sheath C-terminal domain-containing protein [Burkholderiaceae bacterium]
MIEPHYPGVFLNEVAFSAKPIEGVATSNPDLTGMTSLERLASAPDRLRADQELKYVDVRRYTAFLEQSIGKSIQFAAFEPNGEALWQNVRDTVSDFLFNQWHSGALLGARPEEAYFVKCDRSTMTQNDLDNGRLVMVIGVATVHPSEFVILRISTLTASAGA